MKTSKKLQDGKHGGSLSNIIIVTLHWICGACDGFIKKKNNLSERKGTKVLSPQRKKVLKRYRNILGGPPGIFPDHFSMESAQDPFPKVNK